MSVCVCYYMYKNLKNKHQQNGLLFLALPENQEVGSKIHEEGAHLQWCLRLLQQHVEPMECHLLSWNSLPMLGE